MATASACSSNASCSSSLSSRSGATLHPRRAGSDACGNSASSQSKWRSLLNLHTPPSKSPRYGSGATILNPCHHYYHCTCTRQWFETGADSCPLCCQLPNIAAPLLPPLQQDGDGAVHLPQAQDGAAPQLPQQQDGDGAVHLPQAAEDGAALDEDDGDVFNGVRLLYFNV